MQTFPKLKTGAVQQYPAKRSSRFGTQIVRFLDGTEQRYRSAPILRTWVISLDLVDAGEIADLEQFFVDRQGAFESFAFTDPFDGLEYPDCSFEKDELSSEFREELRGKTELIIRENRT